MMAIFAFLGLALFVAVLAAAFTFAANVLFKRASVRKRAGVSALLAGFMPVVPGLVALSVGMIGDAIILPLVSIAALMMGGLVLTAVIAFPVAYLVAKRRPDVVSTGPFE